MHKIVIKKSSLRKNQQNKVEEVVTHLQKYDVIFDLHHLKNLLYEKHFIKTVPEYLNKFFFRYGNSIFLTILKRLN